MKPLVGIIGGTGIDYEKIFSDVKEFSVENQYGTASLKSVKYNDREILFLERHGKGHSLAPHEINYRANIAALKELGVERVIATAAVGAIDKNYRVGTFVLIDDFIDFTKCRKSTFFENSSKGVLHVDMSEPYCPQLRHHILDKARDLGIEVINGGTYVCTEGPRFETKSEIRAYSLMGGHLVGMTNVPEVVLAREMGMCYAAIAMVTNYAAGISSKALTHKEVIDNMNQMSNDLKKLLLSSIYSLPDSRTCSCRYANIEQGTLK